MVRIDFELPNVSEDTRTILIDTQFRFIGDSSEIDHVEKSKLINAIDDSVDVYDGQIFNGMIYISIFYYIQVIIDVKYLITYINMIQINIYLRQKKKLSYQS